MTQLSSNDLHTRKDVWFWLQDFFLDTELTEADIKLISTFLARTTLSETDLTNIMWHEVYPAMKFNIFPNLIGEWTPFDKEWLAERINKCREEPSKFAMWRYSPFLYLYRKQWKQVLSRINILRANEI